MRLTRLRPAVAALVVATLAGCLPVDVQDFVDARTSAICARYARCGALGDNAYADTEACELAVGETANARALNGADECPGFDEDAAAACLIAFDDTACDAAPDLSSCDAVCRD